VHFLCQTKKKGVDMKKYYLLALCVRGRGLNQHIEIKLHAKLSCNSVDEATKKLWHIARKDLSLLFDKVLCFVLGIDIAKKFCFPEKHSK
jgi:hypothetical protein